MPFGKVPTAKLPTEFGDFTVHGFRDGDSGEEAVALVAGRPAADTVPLVRIHSQCLTGDVFGSKRCDCQAQLHTALGMIAQSGAGALVYQQQEGRGIGLINKLHAYELQDRGLDTVAANEHLGFKPDQRDYRIPARILAHLGMRRIRLLSNNPDKVAGLEREGITVVERISLEVTASSSTREYLKVKRDKLGHILSKI
jgi:3,4-dihydroxy 2-butanone 4-phosphate synthase/GTP cyclohydrolase II